MVTTLPPLKIVYASTWFSTTKFTKDEDIEHDCPIPEGYSFDLTNASSWCTITSSQDNIESAAGLIFHAPDSQFGGLPNHVKNQPWILESLEAPFSSLFRANPTLMTSYNYLATYNFKSTFLFSYFSPSIMDIANRPLPKDFMKTKTKAAPILWIAKNCWATSGREKYIQKLMEYVDVHSYGACLNNKAFLKDKSRMDLMAEYKFYLEVENCNCDDYATEKLADTLSISAVPIVDGPPSYEEYLAFRRDAINIAPKDRLTPAFISNWGDTIVHKERSSYCSVCRGLIPWWEAKINDIEYVEPNKDVFLVDNSCSPPGKWNYIMDGPPYTPNWTPRPRDEFTRPDFHDLPQPIVTNTVEPIMRQTSSTVLAANVSFVLLFLVFIVFLIKKSRENNNLRQQDTEPIV